MKRLYAVDLDGTLFYPKHPFKLLPKSTIKILRDIEKRGDVFAAVSGRNFPDCIKLFKKAKITPYIVGCNGTFIYQDGNYVFDNVLDPKIINSILDFSKKTYEITGIFVMSTDTKTYTEKPFPSLSLRIGKFFYELAQGRLLCKSQLSYKKFHNAINNGQVRKIMIMFGVDEEAKRTAIKAEKELIEMFGDKVSICSTDQAVEVTPLNCNKATGTIKLANLLGIDKENVYAFGDSGNDILMFKEFSEHSFCMSHSAEHVKKEAKYIVDTFDDVKNYF